VLPLLNGAETPAGETVWGAPQGLSASQGRYRSVSLSWIPVAGAIRYNVYKSESPFQEFVQCGETTGAVTLFDVGNLSPGATVYFKVAAVNDGYELSSKSNFITGNTLAQPVISDVLANPDNPENSSVIYWYMNNMESGAYEEKVRYFIYCYEGDVEKACLEVNGPSGVVSAVFPNLAAHTTYTYQIDAYTEEEAHNIERSERVDAATARRTKPATPVDLRTIEGGDKSSITLYFELPEKVEVMAGGSYESHPVYFTISRRPAGTSDEYLVVCAYFGADAAAKAAKGASARLFSDYEPAVTDYSPDAAVFWEDASVPERGKKYEYKVQAYADDTGTKVITSSTSADTVTGWAMKAPALAIKSPVYTEMAGLEYAKAELGLEFSHDTLEIGYDYKLHEYIEPIGDGDPRDLPGGAKLEFEYPLTYSGFADYKALIDLTQPCSAANRGRGFYSYRVDVYLETILIDSVDTIGSRMVSESTESVVVENFFVKDGYPDKYVLSFDREDSRKYTIRSAPEAGGPWTVIKEYANGEGTTAALAYTVSVTAGDTRYFSIQAKTPANLPGEIYYSAQAQTLGIPAPEFDGGAGLSYDTANLIWDPVQKADAYRITYTYDDNSETGTADVSAADLVKQGARLVYALKPTGFNIAAKAGKPFKVSMEALNRERQTLDGSGEVKSSAVTINGGRLLGPAELANTVTYNASNTEIKVSWNKVEGAAGYYVVRRQFDINNSAPVTSGQDVRYYVNADASSLIGKNLVLAGDSFDDTEDVSASVQLSGTTFTLTDSSWNDAEYNAKKVSHAFYAAEQNEILWGYPYRYFVAPVLSAEHTLVFNSDYTTWSISGKTLTGIASLEKIGKTPGFVQTVKATKGTFIPDGETNTGVRISWTAPALLPAGATYVVYRRPEASSGDWVNIASATTLYYDNTITGANPPVDGTVYEYLVGVKLDGISLPSRPDTSPRFIEWNRSDKALPYEGASQEESRIAGFILPMPQVSAASPKSFAVSDGSNEDVSWSAVGVDSTVSGLGRGIAGYEIQVKNLNVDGDWHTVRDFVLSGLSGDDYTKTVSTDDVSIDNIKGTKLLQVVRYYHHYYRVRAYTLDEGSKCYSRSPADVDYTAGGENTYIKWATRKITNKEEFTAATVINIGLSLYGGSSISSTNRVTRAISRKTDVFTNLTGSGDLGYCSISALVSTIGAYGVSRGGFISYTVSAEARTYTFTSDGNAHNGSVTISNLRVDSGAGGTFQTNFNSAGNQNVDPKHYLPVFTFGQAAPRDVSGMKWDPDSGWQ
jgi:hypothetical protein